MLSLDTETTGVDLRHGAQPFLVTICYDDGRQDYWEWAVDPLTRRVLYDPDDLEEIKQLVLDSTTETEIGREGQLLVLQNAKFDIGALSTLDPEFAERWPWDRTIDTLLAGHLLASNQPHDLTSMALQYLGANIEKYEQAVAKATQSARTFLRRKSSQEKYPDWQLAKKGRPDMPSAKETVWKADMWLPKALAEAEGYPEPDLDCNHKFSQFLCSECGGHEWWVACSNYANVDSAVTLPIWKQQERMIRARGLWPIFEERLKLLPIVYKMEAAGVTLSAERLGEMMTDFVEEAERSARVCVNIAKSFDYELTLPKGGNNRSLTEFCFGRVEVEEGGMCEKRTEYLGLEEVAWSDKTGEPSLNAKVIEHYLATLNGNTKQATFVRNLAGKRKRDTAVTYMKSYKRFWKPWVTVGDVDPKTGAGWYVLHPRLNPTGTNTLRWSSSDPNEQNVSKQEGFNIRYVFGPAPGREWWSCDAKNIELRIPAYESGEQELIELFERPDEAPYYGSNHLLIFHTLHQDKWRAVEREVGFEKVGPECKKRYASTWYQWTKNGNFAVQYGAVDRDDGMGTADKAYHVKGAQARIASRFQKQEALNQAMIAHATRYGYVETIPDKSVCPDRGYPVMCTRTAYGKIKPTVPLNYHIQSTAMWWMMRAMIKCQFKLDEWRKLGFDGHMVMQVHDELVFDFPKSRIDPKEDTGKFRRSNLWRVRIIQRLMESIGDDIGVPTPVSIEYHPSNWSEGITF